MFPHDAEDRQVTIEIAWCPGCQADCMVEVVALTGDPAPVAVCVECGLGVETWWLPGLLPKNQLGDARAS